MYIVTVNIITEKNVKKRMSEKGRKKEKEREMVCVQVTKSERREHRS